MRRLNYRNWFLADMLAVMAAAAALAAPTLTTIDDILYRADGTRFNGMALVEWKAFQAADNSSIAGSGLTVRITDGRLRVRLVPTTNAVTSAYYTVRYWADGRVVFLETWNVPPSSVSLKLSDVRDMSGGGGTPIPSSISIGDVTGLAEELEMRPVKGLSFQNSRAVMVGPNGQLEGVTGSASDCVRVDGTSGPCAGIAAPAFVDGETPAGAVDGANRGFALAAAPEPASSLALYRNGVLQTAGSDYTLSGGTVTMEPAATPQAGDVLSAYYRRPGTGGSLPTFVDGESPAGAVDGSNQTFTLASAPSPAASLRLYRNGLLQQAGTDYTLSGSAITMTSASIPQPGDTLQASYRVTP